MQSTEYLVILDVLRRARGRERERVYQALRDHQQADLDAAIVSLEQAGVLAVKGERIHASPALERLNELGLIGI